MSADRDPSEELLAAVSDGAPADWEAACRDADAEERAWLESLREVSRIASFNRGLQRTGAPPVLLAPCARLGTYEIVGTLGVGGMGEVYRARDLRLGRDVALKVLPATLARDAVHLARIEREARSVAALNHPNIVTLFSIEDEDETRFLTMELVEGQSLADQVAPGGLRLPRVLDIAIAIADALAAAHEKGVVHRDLKPANVMVTREGRVKVLDFGLARQAATTQDATQQPPIGSAQPEPSTTMGTVPYMAPEQIRGEPTDVRTDLFAFGIVLYELVAGHRPFAGADAGAVSAAILHDNPMPLSHPSALVRGELTGIVDHCLAKDPSERVLSALDVGRALRRLRGLLDRRNESMASVAVLPFVNRSRDEGEEYFSDGLAEELLNVLTKIHGLRVAARSSSFRFKGKDATIAEVGSALNVATVLEGTVRRAGTRVRIAVQLVNVADGYHLWSETYDRTLDDIFAVQDDIAQCVVKELRATLLGGERAPDASGQVRTEVARAGRGRSTNAEAHRLLFMARHLTERDVREDTDRSVAYLKEAIKRDPGFALAWAELGRVYGRQADLGHVRPAEGYALSREAVERALAIDPDLAKAHVHLGRIRMHQVWDLAGAQASFARALALEPSSAAALGTAGVLAAHMGRHEEAIELCQRATEVDPLGAANFQNLGWISHAADRLSEAEASYRRALILAPRKSGTHAYLSQTLLALGRGDEALEEALREPVEPFRLWAFALIHHGLGARAESDKALRALIERFADDAAAQIAEVLGARGDADAAFQWIERACTQRDPGVFELTTRPSLRALHSDPRWSAFLRTTGLDA